MKHTLTALLGVVLLAGAIGCSTPLSTREKATGVGALGGAAAGGIIGATVGHPAGAGALIGDQMQSNEQKQADQQRQIDRNREETERLRREQEQPPPSRQQPREY